MSEYFDSIDVYLQILYDAQRVEDQKLVRMIRDRLKQHARHLAAGDAGGGIIPFPLNPTSCGAYPVEPARPAWPRNPLVQVAAIVGIYGYTIVLYLLLGL